MVATGKAQPALKCPLCGEIFPLHSNLAIAEELLRISDYLEPMVPRCPNLDCAGLEPHCTKYGVTCFNYCEVGQDKKTPAMRMGLARGPVAPEDILYFEPAAPTGQRRRASRKAPAVTTETSVSP